MFEISNELEALGKSVIDEFDEFKTLRDGRRRICYQYSDQKKTSNGKTVYADTTKINDKIKSVAKYDFIITFYKPNCSVLDKEKMRILMRHELKHVGYADGKCSIIPHDVEDFSDIIAKHGMDWTI